MTEARPVTNPYIAGSPVTGQEMFFGREDVFEFVRQALIGRHQDNIVVLYGQRRTGKTTVLYQMHRHIDPRYIPVLIDLQALSMEGMATFLWEIASSICRILRRDLQILVERPAQEEFLPDPREFFQAVFLNRVWDAIGDRHLLLMFDESVRLEDQVLAGRLEREVFDYLRHLMQHNQRLNFLFSIGSRLEEMQQEYTVLFGVALYKKISFLDPEATRVLITEPVQDIYEYEDQAVEYILEVGGRHAYYTQLICHSVFTLWERSRPEKITVQDVQTVLPEVIERGIANFTFVWDQASPIEKLVLTAMGDLMPDQSSPVSVSQVQQTLAERDISLSSREINHALLNLVQTEAVNVGEGYEFAVDLMRLYIRDNQRIDWVQEELAEQVEELRRAEPVSAVAVKHHSLVRTIIFGGAASLIGALLVTVLMLTSPFSLFAPSQAALEPTATPTSTPLATPTPVPPAAGLYTVDRCGLTPGVLGEARARLLLCVESVQVNSDGTMRFNVSWNFKPEQTLAMRSIGKTSDVGNTNMYVTDNRGNRYDFVDLGGAARAEETLILRGESATGWFLFPPPKEDARRFTFHDDDNFWAIAGIILE